MEKTLARAIYKLMQPGKEYTTTDLVRLIGNDYYKYVPVENHPFQKNGKPVSYFVREAMWKVVKTGYARTFKQNTSVGVVRGKRFGSEITKYTEYTERVWVRVK